MGHDVGAEICPVSGERFFRQSFGSAHKFTVNTAALAPLTGAVLHGLNLHVVPIFPERRENATMMRHIAIPVGGAFPDAHCGQVRWLQRSDVPLIDAVVRNPVEPDLTLQPPLRAHPSTPAAEIFSLAP